MSATAYRRPGSEARHVRELIVARLPPVVRDRLALCLGGGGAPVPLLVDLVGRGTPSAQLFQIVVVVAAIVEAKLWFSGFGEAGSALALQSPAYAAAHAAAAFALLFGAIHAARTARARGGVTFRDGRFLFALDLVEIAGRSMRVTDLATLRRIEARPGKHGPAVVLVFADGHEVPFEAQPRAEALALRAKEAVDAALALILPDDLPRMIRLDPFFELRLADDWASAEVDANERRSLLARAPLPALAAALFVASALAGLGLHALRNRLSDDEMFVEAIELAERTNDPHRWRIGAYAGVRHVDEIDAIRFDRARGDVEALNDYLRHEGARTSDAEAALFDLTKHDPKALAAAVRRGGAGAAQAEAALYELQKGDLDALVDYIRQRGPRADQADDQLFALARKSGDAKSYRLYLKHGRRHADEVQSVLLPAAAYLEVETSDDVGLLGAFVREYPDGPHAGEIKAKIHALYADALRTYRARKPSAAGLRFVTALLAELEDRADPSVNLDVNITYSASLFDADAKLATRYGADYLPANDHFDGEARVATVIDLRTRLVERILSSFANGTVRPLGMGAPLGAATGRPLIAVLCEPVPVASFTLQREKLTFSDVRFSIDFHAVVPARSHKLSWKLTTPGVKGFDAIVDSVRAGAENVNRDDVAQASYAWMRSEGAKQVLDRIELDF